MEIVEPGYTLTAETKSPETDLSFVDVYDRDKRLRSGSFGTVYTCHHKLHPELTYAVKILERKKLKQDEAVFREVSILKLLLEIPHVVRLIDFFVDPEHFYMVQVYAEGGDVFDRLSARSNYTEKDARDLAKVLLETIQSLHQAKIVHRDLKPENLLLKSPVDDTSILLADFGFARKVPEGGCRSRCGTPAFVSPEIILNIPYDVKVDLWSIGCIVYMLIGGYPPFQASNHRELFRKVRAGDFIFHEKYWKNVSVAAKTLISGLLTVNPASRWDVSTALQSDWFQKLEGSSLRENDLSGSLAEFKKFKPQRKWKSIVKAVGFCSTAPFWNPNAVSFSQQMTVWDEKLLSASQNPEGMAQSEPVISKTVLVKFADVYDLKAKLRKGSYATVWECEHKQSKQIYAAKIIQRNGLTPKDDEAVLNEVAIMQSLHGNEYTVQLTDFYEEEDKFYLVMTMMAGGDVFDRIVTMTTYTEKDARDLTVILLKATASIHKAGIAHRDIKPQNLMLTGELDNADIKIGDFGFSRRVHTPCSLTQRFGTPSYVAPEVLKNIPHDERVDLWSIGVVIFVLLVGYPPFLEEKQADLFAKIRAGEWKFLEEDWAHISQDAKDLIKGLLVTDPKERWTIEEALRCKWIQQDSNQLSITSLSGSVRSLKLRKGGLRSLARAFFAMGKDTKTTEVNTQADDLASEAFEKLKLASAQMSKASTQAVSTQSSKASVTKNSP